RYMKKEWISFHDLGAYQYFIQLKDNGADLTPYYTSVLGPLIDYDSSHHSHLIKTFEAYIENNLKLQSTADQLFIHRHTLTYRLEQIKKKTARDIHLANDRIQLHLAVMAYRIDQMLSWE
ncbi:MAG TPA: helix-turn-helix domain-containing protein, partial [Bacillales bacterium]